MDENKTVTIQLQKLIDIHNSLTTLHPTGQDIVTTAGIIMELRNLISEEVKDEH